MQKLNTYRKLFAAAEGSDFLSSSLLPKIQLIKLKNLCLKSERKMQTHRFLSTSWKKVKKEVIFFEIER